MKGKRVDKRLIEGALRKFLEDEQHLVLGFEKAENRVKHRLFKKNLQDYSLFNPYFSVNGAIYLRRLFSKGTKIILMLRPCEIRAYGELTKLSQIERESIIGVSVDCFGAVSLKNDVQDIPTEVDALKDYFDGTDSMRWPCTVCRERKGVVGDAGIRVDTKGSLLVFPYTERGEEFLSLFDDGYEANGAEMLIKTKDKVESFQSDMETFSKDISKCIMCMNCRDMCPVCYCIDCVFNGDDYLPKGDALLNKVFRSGSAMLPQGRELFHFIRMYHVSQTCVGCGACEEACPQGVPLTKYFKGISERLQGMFSYMAGRNFDESIPYLTFIEEELKDAED